MDQDPTGEVAHNPSGVSICFAFDTTNRLANAFQFFVPGPAGFEAGAKFLLARGYQ